ncbi:MAG: stage II sporulation protein M [Candidatus Pacearchaeota archaeon]
MNKYVKYINYIKKNRNYIYFILILYFFSSILGYFFYFSLEEKINNLIKEILKITEGMNFFQIFIFIFQNNLKTAFFGLIFGLFFGIYPLFLTLINGYILGYIIKFSIKNNDVMNLWKLLPHGIFELFAVLLSFAFGLKLGISILKKGKNFKDKFFKEFSLILEIFIYVILPLLFLAALIETLLIFLVR